MKRKPKLEVFEGWSDWHWRVKGGNGRIMFQGEGHRSERDATRAAHRSLQVAAQLAKELGL